MRSLFLSFLLSLLSVFSSFSFLFPLTRFRAEFSNCGHRFNKKQRSSLHLRTLGSLEGGQSENLHAFASLTTNSLIPPIGNDDFSDIAMLEERDLSELSRHVLSVFGVNFVRWTMGGDSLGSTPVGAQQPFCTSTNAMAAAYAEILLGFQYRLGKRLKKMNLLSPLKNLSTTDQGNPIPGDVERDSLVLVISRNQSSNAHSAATKVCTAGNTEIVASVELSLEPMEILHPNSDKSVALPNGTTDYVPYVRNLCVNQDFQRRNYGTTLMQCVEHITKNIWGFNTVSLHVFDDNVIANVFYLKMGYQVLSKDGGIVYYEKPLVPHVS